MRSIPRVILVAFAISLFFHFFELGVHELQGDEASGVLNAIKTLLGVYSPKLFGNIFLFGHAPMRVLENFPALVFGQYSEWFFRAPNALFGALSIFPIYFISKKLFSMKAGVYASFLYAYCPIFFGNRLAMGVGTFLFFHTLGFYFLLKYLDSFKKRDFFLFGAFMATAILTYVEGALFFFPMVFLLFRSDKNVVSVVKENILSVFGFGGILFSFLGAWFGVPYLLVKKGIVEDFAHLGGFRVLSRATDIADYVSFSNFDLLSNHLTIVGFVVTLILLVYFLASNLKDIEKLRTVLPLVVWAGFPLIYFGVIVSNPTNHLLFYFSYIVIMAGATIASINNPRHELIITSLLCSIYFFAFFKVRSGIVQLDWGPQKELGIKKMAPYLRSTIRIDEKLFISGVEGYIFQYYVGRGYSEDISSSNYILSTIKKEMEGFKLQSYLECANLFLYVRTKGELSSKAVSCDSDAGLERYSSLKRIIPYFSKKYLP